MVLGAQMGLLDRLEHKPTPDRWERSDHPADSGAIGCSAIRRVELSKTAWLDHAPGWLNVDHEALFKRLTRTVRWNAGRRKMYDRMVDVPRLTATLPEDGPVPLALSAPATELSQRYDRNLDRIGLAWYRNGDDSVAWHRDKLRERNDSLVAIVSLGEPRPFKVRPFGGGPSRTFRLGWGDLLVMGGSCQRDFEHCVPKQKYAAPRMSVMFRHGYQFER